MDEFSSQLTLFGTPQVKHTNDDYYTPKWIFTLLGIEFDIDVASPPEGPLYTPCKRYFTKEDDGLAQPWNGTVWMNPPFSDYTPWLLKWLAHGDGILLCPVVKSNWFFELWDSDAKIMRADQDAGGIEFHTLNGQKRIMLPVVLAAIGETGINALTKSGLGKVR